MLDVFTIQSPALPRDTRVVGFRGAEGISRLYAFEIHLTLGPDAADAFELSSAVGAKGALVLDRQDGGPPFAFHGLFSEASLVHHEPDGRALVRAVLVPRLWRLTQTQHSRVFTQQSIPDILQHTLEDGGLTSDDYRLQLSRQYPAEEHVCQYRESHFDFISRWMEREGLYYYFEQGDDGEKLIITDTKSAHEALVPAPVRFFALVGADATARACLQSFVCRHRALPARVRFKDYDYAKPALDVSSSAPVSKAGLGEISVHGARFFTPEAGERLAQIRAEEILSREQVFTGSGTTFHLRAGYTFTLQDHPRASFDAEYLVTEAEHYGNQSASTPELKRLTGLALDEVYHVDVTAIPAAVQLRAEPRTTWPRIYGTEHGIVDGEADTEYAQLDDQGRYAVRFAFDESDLGEGKASTRVRMMQPHGGGVEGWHFPLRKGTEVLFTFLGGDPDRPVIAGVVPNAHTPSPVTKANHTRNVIQTGGRNRIELEDKHGFERVTLSTPHSNTMIRMGAPNADHNMIVRTDGDTLLDAGRSWDVTVGENLTEDVIGETQETYQGDHTTASWSKRTIDIGGRYTQSCHGSVARNVKGSVTTDIKGHDKLTVGTYAVRAVGGDEEHTVGGSQSLTVTGSVTQTCGACTFDYAQLSLTSKGPVVIQGPSVKIKSGGTWLKASAGPTIELYTSKNAVGGQKFDGTSLKLEATVAAFARVGAKIDFANIKCDNSSMKLKQDKIEINTTVTKVASGALRVFSYGLTKL